MAKFTRIPVDKKTTVSASSVSVTIETKTPICFMPIGDQDTDATSYYERHGIRVATFPAFGRLRTYALVPVDDCFDALDESERMELKNRAENFNRCIDNERRKQARATQKMLDHVSVVLTEMMENGYDPTIGLGKPHQAVNGSEADDQDDDTEDEDMDYDDMELPDDFEEDYDYPPRENVIRNTYDPDADMGNPANIVERKMLYAKMYALIDELDDVDLAIVNMIMNEEISERKLAKELGMSRTTLQDQKKRLLKRFKEYLR